MSTCKHDWHFEANGLVMRCTRCGEARGTEPLRQATLDALTTGTGMVRVSSEGVQRIQLDPQGSALTVQAVYEPPNPVTRETLCDWIASARAGHAIKYYEGYLLVDRSELSSALPPKDRAQLHAMARRAWMACELGLVHLFSQKVGEGLYRYLAVRSAKPLAPPG